MENFCGSPLWGGLEGAYLTPCFERTVLAWSPCVFLWFFLAVELHYLTTSKSRGGPRSTLFLTKMLGTVITCGVAIADFGYAISLSTNGHQVYAVDFTTPVIQAISYFLAGVLLEMNRRRGLRSSGLLFQFWFLVALCGAPRCRSLVNSALYTETFEVSFLFVSFLAAYVCSVLVFLLCWPAEPPPASVQPPITKNTCPERQASFVSRLTFSWFDSMAWLGFRRPLEAEDMWELHPREASASVVNLFDSHWSRSFLRAQEQAKGKKNKNQASILPALWKAFGPTFLFGSFLKFISDVTGFFNPVLLQLLIGFVWSDAAAWEGYLYAALLFANVSLTTLVLSQYFHRMFTVGLRIRAALISAIFRKSLRLSSAARRDTTVGEIVNLMSVDAQRFMDLIAYFNMVWSNPLQFSLCFYLLWIKLGPSVLAGLAVLLLLMPLDAVVAARVRTLQIRQMRHKDERIKLLSEILAGIKVLKLYAWEKCFEEKIKDIRSAEVYELKKSAYYDAANSFIWNFAPILVSLVSFATFVLSSEENILDADTAFVSLTLFNMMRYSLTMFPVMITSIMQASVSVKRINKFMNLEELDPSAVSHEEIQGAALLVEGGCFSWDGSTPVLRELEVRVKSGSLVAVVGSVGAGKSSLIAALLGHVTKLKGRVNSTGSIAYVPQQAWIQNATLRDNVLFGSPLEQARYEAVLEACALNPDLRVLPAGDRTEIGEKGINLSGGQKQRVSLARAAYSERDILLMDDPLSAVDSGVAKHLFEHVIGPRGILRDKTRLLVTHSVWLLAEVDEVLVLHEGRVAEAGSFSELVARGGILAGLLQQHEKQTVPITDDDKKPTEESEVETNQEQVPKEKVIKKLIEAEKSQTGSVEWSVYAHYLSAVGVGLGVATLLFSVLQQTCAVASNVWLARWSSQQANSSEPLPPDQRDFYLGIYGALGGLQALLVLIPTITLVLAGVRAAVRMHAQMLQHTMHNPIGFFDTTPAGRVMNRFSKDVDVVDNTLPVNIRTWLGSALSVLATLIVISVTNQFFLVAILPIAVFYYIIQRFYIPTSRQLKRLESVTRSPIYSHFGESLNGTSSIRAYACEQRFATESEKRVDTNQMPYYLTIIANRWLAIRLEMLGNLVILCAALLAVIARDSMSPGAVGLSLSYALQITATLNFLVRTTSDVETNIVAVERIKEYGETPQEAEWDIPETQPAKEWPSQGVVEFIHYEMRYREGLDLVLHDVTFKLNAGEKVGVVGRTGAGKSSLALGLFRVVESSGGHVLIDGEDISRLGLHALRSRLTVIPQDPVLFAGSIRSNLDPAHEHGDPAIWRALELAHLGAVVRAQPAGLDWTLGEAGEGLSAGQRQLVCLARAILRKTRVLVLDEATAAVDIHTDELIQHTVREEFRDCTVLTIAHRLNTILDYDRVLVMEQGRVAENGAPNQLLATHNSMFTKMARDAGIAA